MLGDKGLKTSWEIDMDEEAQKIEDMRKRGKLSAGQAEKLRKALPGHAKKEGATTRVRKLRWMGLALAGATGATALLIWSQLQIHQSTRMIESNLDALRQQGFVLPSHFPGAVPQDTVGSELAYVVEGRRVGLPLRQTEVQVDIHTDVARVFVTQLYVNATDQVIEAIYTFPLPFNSAVDSMIMTVGGKRIRGVIQKRQEARKTYERAKEAGKTASLLEQERPNIFTQNIANILPQDSILITLSFLQEVKHIAPFYYYHFPTVVGPRYTAHTQDAGRISPPLGDPADAEFKSRRPKLTLEFRLHSGVPVRNLESASHKLAIESLEEKNIHLRLMPADSLANKDFLLKYQLAGETIKPSLQAEDGHFKLTVMPQFDPVPEAIFNRELVFVMDVSGSMRGAPMQKSKEVMGHLLRNLRKRDRFRVVAFSTDADELAPQSLEGSPENIRKAMDFVSGREVGGGTEMHNAVKKALAFEHGRNIRRIFLFMTDGFIGNEAAIIHTIQKNLGDSRVFTLGIGSSVNRYLLEAMAVAGRGVDRVIRQDGNAQEAMEDFYRTVDSPVLSNLSLQWTGIEVSEVLPQDLPDLFLGHPLTVVGKYQGNGRGSLTLTGLLPSGGKFRQTLPVDFSALQPSNSAVKTLWARRKVEDLELHSTGMFGNGIPERDSAKHRIESLGLQYRIMTAHTSLVAVLDEVRNTKGEWIRVEQKVEVPEGMDPAGLLANIDNMSGLTGTGSTPISSRRGKVESGWNEGEAVGGTGSIDDLLGGMWGKEDTSYVSMKLPPPLESDSSIPPISVKAEDLQFEGDGRRSAESLLRIIRSHALGLRHLYIKHQRRHTEFKGRITLKLTIDASGKVLEVKLVGTTTGVSEFDEVVRTRVSSWRFEPIKGPEKVVVTIPFDFAN